MNRLQFLLTALACLLRPVPSCPQPKPVFPAGDPRKEPSRGR